jgi:RHS repeat-associated protein
MSQRMKSWGIPVAAFLVAVLLAKFAGPSLGFSSRSMMGPTGKRYYCVKRCEPGGEICDTQESDTPIDGWECEEMFPVSFRTGFNAFNQKDLSTRGLSRFFVTRMYVQDPGYSDNGLGPCWRVGWFYRVIQTGTNVVVVSGNDPIVSFTDNGNGTYTADFNYVQTLVADTVNHLLVLTDARGKQWKFFDFSGNWNPARQGRLKEFDDKAGNITTTIYGTSGVTLDQLIEVQQTDTNPSLFHRFDFAYNLSGSSIGLLASITYSQTNTGVTQTVRVANYTYYASGGTDGPAGTLRKVVITDGTNALDTSYYRYNAADAGGFVPLRYAVLPQAYDRLVSALTASLGHPPSDTEVDAAADATIATYADYYFVYDGFRRVIQETVQGQGCGCGSSGSRGIFNYAYATSTSLTADGPNVWRYKTTVTLPNGNLRIVFTNSIGQTMLDVFKDSTSGLQWCKYFVFNSDNSLAALAFPSAVTGYTEGTDILVSSAQLPDNSGLWHLVDYYTSTNLGAGAVAKYVQNLKIRQGELGAPILTETFTFSSRTGSVGTIYPLASSTRYRNTDGSGTQTKSYSYNSWQGTSTQYAQMTMTFPTVPTTQNGSGSPTTAVFQADVFDRVTSITDEDGIITAATYDTLTGAISQRRVDTATLNLTTSFRVDLLGRTTKMTDPLGLITYAVYNDALHQRRVYPGWTGTTTTGPITMSREDRPGSYRENLSMSAAPNVTGGEPDGTEAVSSLQSLRRDYTDTGNRVTYADSYFNFTGLTYSTAVNIGSQGTNFYRKSFNYDVEGHKDRDVDWTGTIRRTFYDSRDRVLSTWIGTNDTPASGDWSPTNNTAPSNMIKVTQNQYDSGGVGDGNLTLGSVYTSAIASLDTAYLYDFRDRRTDTRGPDMVAVRSTYDNLSEVITVETYSDQDLNFVIGSSELRGRSESKFDERGLVYLGIQHNVSNTGVIGNHLTSNFWYNGRRMLVKEASPNGLFQKTKYDGARRIAATFASFDDAETTYAQTFDVVGDTVIDETVLTYDADGNVLYTTRYERTSTASVTGDLATGWAVGNARRTFVAHWFDVANRLTTTAKYGNNGDATFKRPATAPAPSGSANILVTKYEYDAGGRENKTTDNLAKFSQTTFDGLSRPTRVVEDFVDGAAAETELDTDRITDFVFDTSGRLSQMIAYNPKGSGKGVQSQTTQYIYGTIANLASPLIFRNDVLVAEIYPDSDDTYNPAGAAGSQLGNGADGVYDRVEYTYDYAGRRLTLKNQRQDVHTYAYIDQQNSPGAGKLTTDTAAVLGPGTDGSARSIVYAYDSLSRLQQTKSYADTGFAQLLAFQFENYDGWGNVFQSYERHTSSSPSVYFFTNYIDGAVGTEAKYVRLASYTYQSNSRGVYFNYGAAGSASDKLNRVDSVSDDQADTQILAQYTYLGQGSPVTVARPGVTGGLTLNYGAGTGSPAGWDRFGRVIDHKWGSTADPSAFERFQHTYDKVSDRLTSDRTYTGAPTNRDEQYVYDNLHRLKTMKRGMLASGSISNVNSTLIYDWTALEAQGNWRTWRTSPGGQTSPVYSTQARVHNSANEIDVDNNDANAPGASIKQTGGTGMNWIDPQYDKNGNMANGPQPGAETTARLYYTYDAWNRLTKVQADNGGVPGATIALYQYDGIHRRIAKLKPNGSNWDRVDYYYTAGWQVVEERSATALADTQTVATVPSVQWVWDPRYVDAPILRDQNKDGDGSCTGPADQRLYYVQDANWNTTALLTTAGAVVERYAYTPYGQASVFTASWATQSPTIYSNEVLFAGYRLDPETQLYHVRQRAYHSSLGRWLQRDPIGYKDSMDLYEYIRSAPVMYTDPTGLESNCTECTVCVYGAPVQDARAKGYHHASIQIEDCNKASFDIHGGPSDSVNAIGFGGNLKVTTTPTSQLNKNGASECKTFACDVCDCIKSKANELNGMKLHYSATTFFGANSNSAADWILQECKTGMGKDIDIGKGAIMSSDDAKTFEDTLKRVKMTGGGVIN